MKDLNYTLIPEEFEMLSFFEVEPIKANPKDGFWCYEKDDGKGQVLRFSCNIYEKSIQTNLLVNGEKIEVISHEGVKQISIVEEDGFKILKCESDYLPLKTILLIRLKPKLYMRWYSLIIQD